MSYRSMLTTGKKRKTFVNITSEQLVEDGQGGFVRTWTTIYKRILARMNALTTKEMQVLYQKQDVNANYTVNLEYLSGIEEGQRLVKLDDSREFAIKLVMDWDEDRDMLKLACLEVERLE